MTSSTPRGDAPVSKQHEDPRQRLDDLRHTRDAVLATLAGAVEQIERGTAVTGEPGRRVAAWNDALTSAGRLYGLTGAELSVDRLEQEVERASEKRRQRAQRRAELDHKIAALDALIAEGSAGRDHLLRVRQELLRLRDADDGSATA